MVFTKHWGSSAGRTKRHDAVLVECSWLRLSTPKEGNSVAVDSDLSDHGQGAVCTSGENVIFVSTVKAGLLFGFFGNDGRAGLGFELLQDGVVLLPGCKLNLQSAVYALQKTPFG